MSELADIVLSRTDKDKTEWKIPADQDVDWWYIVNDEDEHKEGVAIHIGTPKRYYNVTLSTEVIVEMYRTVVEAAVDGPVQIDLSKAPMSYQDAIFAEGPSGYWSFDEDDK